MRATAGILLTLLLGCAHPLETARLPASQPAPDSRAAQTVVEDLSAFPVPAPRAAEGPVRFAEVLPILESRCSPCHFPGGSMHERLPFERPATIRALGTKLFTRIKDPADQALILRFLSSPPEDELGPGAWTRPAETQGSAPYN